MSLTDIHKKNKILKVEDSVKLEQFKLGYKACNNLLLKRLLNCLFTDSKDRTLKKTHKYNTRHKEFLNGPVMSSTMYRNSYMNMCMKEYTSVAHTNNVRQKQSTKMVFKQYKDTLLSK